MFEREHTSTMIDVLINIKLDNNMRYNFICKQDGWIVQSLHVNSINSVLLNYHRIIRYTSEVIGSFADQSDITMTR